MFSLQRSDLLLIGIFLVVVLLIGMFKITESSDQKGEVKSELAIIATEEKKEQKIVVHIAGAVLKPGVYTLPVGTRIVDCIEAAGGALAEADLNSINLAATLRDGTQIFIHKKGEIKTSSQNIININRANQSELESLPGIGAVRAAEIISYRNQKGPFQTVCELLNISGIGSKTLANLEELIGIY